MPSSLSPEVERPRIDMDLTPVKVHLPNGVIAFRSMKVESKNDPKNKGIVHELRRAETVTDAAIGVAWFDNTSKWYSIQDFLEHCDPIGVIP